LYALALILGVVASSGTARGQAGATRGAFPEKNQHVFVPTTFIPDAFVDTELTIGIGYSNTIATDIPLFTAGGQQIGTVKGDLLFLNGSVDLNCALRDWIGFFGRFQVLARSGNNTASIFASGLSAGSGFGMGWEFRLNETEKSMLSGSVSLDRTSVTLIDIAAFIDNPNRGLSTTFTPLVGSANARYAYGVNELIGLSGFGGVGVGENPAENYDSTWFWKLGAVASINLARRHDIPLGFALGVRTSSYPITFDNADGNAWAGLASIAYMGRPDFSITLDTVYEHVPIDYQDVAVGYLGFTLGLTYCF
jgi:hypothetical protein